MTNSKDIHPQHNTKTGFPSEERETSSAAAKMKVKNKYKNNNNNNKSDFTMTAVPIQDVAESSNNNNTIKDSKSECVDESKVESGKPKLADGFFEIEAVRRKRVRKGEIQYLIKWRGWPETSNTWEPFANLQSCSDVIDAFEESLHSTGKQKKRKRKHKDGIILLQSKKQQLSSATATPERRRQALVSANELTSIDHAAVHCTGSAPDRPSDAGLVSSEVTQTHVYTEERRVGNEHCVLHETLPKEHGYENSAIINKTPISNGGGPGPSTLSKGSRRRKPKSVKRFRQDSTLNEPDVNLGAGSTGDGSGGPVDPGSVILGQRTAKLRNALTITEIIMPVSLTASVSNNVQDVEVKFVAKRSDGAEIIVDNKYLKDHNPLLLINYYERHLRNTPNIPY